MTMIVNVVDEGIIVFSSRVKSVFGLSMSVELTCLRIFTIGLVGNMPQNVAQRCITEKKSDRFLVSDMPTYFRQSWKAVLWDPSMYAILTLLSGSVS